ncbi:MAG: hypothetical protein HQL24_05870 [Candidatus Omnitrophica bacterium]|nr:hypothetical protein [Candidatus Omnitrophota bacterium]
MNPEKKTKIAEMLALVVSCAAMLVIIGWIFNIPFLKSLSPSWVTMKFVAAVAFLLSGVSLYFIVRAKQGLFDQAQVILFIVALILVLYMGLFLFSILFKIETNIEDLLIHDANPVKTAAPGQPSLFTIINFLLIALADIFTILNPERLASKLRVIGFLVGAIGAIAVMGYILNVPILYYYMPGFNTAMACHTAILFVLLGVGLLCLSD